jgi:hypothetical protein
MTTFPNFITFLILFIKYILLFFIFCIYLYCHLYSSEIDKQVLFKHLMDEFTIIFPDNNRNAGGPQFFHHIYNMKDTLSKETYFLYHTFYCGVSGSPIDPNRNDRYDYVKVKHVNHKDYIGKYYRCCWSCICDVEKYTIAEDFTIELNNETFKHIVLTINDPCKNKDKIPNEVSSFQCINHKTNNGIHTNSGRLIVAVLHDSEVYNKQKQKIYVKKEKIHLLKTYKVEWVIYLLI